jgi:hypothetical protein
MTPDGYVFILGLRVTGIRNWNTGSVEGVLGSIGSRVLVIGMAGARRRQAYP